MTRIDECNNHNYESIRVDGGLSIADMLRKTRHLQCIGGAIMRTESFFQTMSDGAEVAVNRWLPDEGVEIKGILALSHGMVEHAMRYDRFGCDMVDAGWVLNAHDHRGHGRTAQKAQQDGKGKFGLLAKEGGFDRVVQDLDEVIVKLAADVSGKDIFLLGHSFGSFVAQSYIETADYVKHIKGCILCGTAGPERAKIGTGVKVCRVVKAIKGAEGYSSLLEKLAFGAYCNKIKAPKTPSDWLSRDEVSVQLYRDDAWCQFRPTVQFFCDLMGGMQKVHSISNIIHIPTSLPILSVHGTDDPVGNYGKSVATLMKAYHRCGIKDVTSKAYEGARHELLNETNRDEVVHDILEWLNAHVGA